MIIEKEATNKSAADIAFLVDRSVEEVKIFLQSLATEAGVQTREAVIQAKDLAKKEERANRPKKIREAKPKKPKAPKQFDRVITQPSSRQMIELQQKKRREKEQSQKRTTRAIDYSQLHAVQVAKGTWAYVKDPNDAQELEAARERYQSNLVRKMQTNGSATQEVLKKVNASNR